jgi:hypothetical protein
VLIKDDSPTNENGDSLSAIEDSADGGSFLTPQTTTQGGGNSWRSGGNNGATATGGGPQDYTYGRNANYTPRNGDLRTRDNNSFQNHSQTNDDFAFMPDDPSDGLYDDGNGNDSRAKFTRQQYDKFAKRTVLLANLPEGITHADIVDVVSLNFLELNSIFHCAIGAETMSLLCTLLHMLLPFLSEYGKLTSGSYETG